MAKPVDEGAEAPRILIQRIMSDRVLPERIRTGAEALLEIAESSPGLAEIRLRRLYDQEVHGLPLNPPDQALCRCIPLSTFFLYHMDPDEKALYRDSIDFQVSIEQLLDPAAELARVLSRESPLFRAAHSWMAPCDQVSELDGAELRRALALRDSIPPYVLFFMPLRQLKAAAVLVRRATALDAIPAGITYWDVDGLPTGILEYVDQDIPVGALDRVEWRA